MCLLFDALLSFLVYTLIIVLFLFFLLLFFLYVILVIFALLLVAIISSVLLDVSFPSSYRVYAMSSKSCFRSQTSNTCVWNKKHKHKTGYGNDTSSLKNEEAKKNTQENNAKPREYTMRKRMVVVGNITDANT